jgi:hypothetical protein
MKRSILCITLMVVFAGLAVLSYFAVEQFTPLKTSVYPLDGSDPLFWMQKFATMVIAMVVAVLLVSLAFFAIEEWGMKKGSIPRVILQLLFDVVILVVVLVYAKLNLAFFPTPLVNISLWVYVYPAIVWLYLVFTTVMALPPHTRAGIFRKTALI